jgi:hypothetical protein
MRAIEGVWTASLATKLLHLPAKPGQGSGCRGPLLLAIKLLHPPAKPGGGRQLQHAATSSRTNVDKTQPQGSRWGGGAEQKNVLYSVMLHRPGLAFGHFAFGLEPDFLGAEVLDGGLEIAEIVGDQYVAKGHLGGELGFDGGRLFI